MLNYDLHCHATVSEGLPQPTGLLARAAGRGIKFMALTYHDDLSGFAEAIQAAAQHEMVFINARGISVSWRSHTMHFVGSNIDPSNTVLRTDLHNEKANKFDHTGQTKLRSTPLANPIFISITGGAMPAYRRLQPLHRRMR